LGLIGINGSWAALGADQMMYQHFVLKVLLIQVFFLAVPIAVFALIYFGAGMHKEEYRGCALAVIGGFCGCWLIFNAWGCFPEIYDCVQYLRQGDSYVREDVCHLEDVRSSVGRVGLVTARNRLHCRDGKEFVSEYRRDYPRVLWRWAKEQRILRVRYLPRSLLVLELNDLGSGY